jgi:hypothetical protein
VGRARGGLRRAPRAVGEGKGERKPRNEGGRGGAFILREGIGVLLEELQCLFISHFEDGGRDEGIARDSLSVLILVLQKAFIGKF